MNNTKNIRWGILGAGKIARAFATDFQYLNGADLLAIGSREAQKARGLPMNLLFPRR